MSQHLVWSFVTNPQVVGFDLVETELLDSHWSHGVYFRPLQALSLTFQRGLSALTLPPSTTIIWAFILAADVLFVVAIRPFERVHSVAAALC
jgi:hypothetical protein